MAKITHPNVAAVYDVGLVDDSVFIAMELIEGPTLETWTRAMARPWTEVLRMYLLAGRGLAAAHEAGLVHRDFKVSHASPQWGSADHLRRQGDVHPQRVARCASSRAGTGFER
jgi:serine/threonine protein kinase